jgi:hypothetical protein
MSTIEERIARIEAQREHEMRDAAELKRKIEKVETTVDEVRDAVFEIKSTMGAQRGFVAGALMVLTFIWGVIGALAVGAYNYFIGKGDIP